MTHRHGTKQKSKNQEQAAYNICFQFAAFRFSLGSLCQGDEQSWANSTGELGNQNALSALFVRAVQGDFQPVDHLGDAIHRIKVWP